jgi:P-type Ca2+ transporter type 2C
LTSGELPWQSLSAQDVSSRLEVNQATGLSREEARARLAKYGPNVIREEKQEPLWEEFLKEAREPIIILLFVTGVFYALFGGLEDALVIVAVIITLVSVEVLNEYRAGKAVASLRRLAEPVALVRRDDGYREVATEEVVPGDVVLLQAGRRVPADARLVEAHSVAVDESPLTGESAPVEKAAEATLAASTPLAERLNLVFAGTTVLRGKGAGIAVATGASTEMGKIGRLAGQLEAPPTLLQRTMNELVRWMVWLALGFSAAVPLLGWLLVHQPLQQMILTGLSLAFATIPEELPIIITMVLALGAYRLSKKQAIVKQLQAVETLGAVTAIAADKTGTLTENKMELKMTYPEEAAERILEIGVLCNDASKDGGGFAGEPIDTALLEAAAARGIDIESSRSAHPLRFEFTFDNRRKLMSVVYDHQTDLWVGVKGAPEEVLAHSTRVLTEGGESSLADSERLALREMEERITFEGLRVVAFAQARRPRGEVSQEEAESGLTFVGLAGLADPPRPEVKDAIAASRAAGIRTLMITGDHPVTASAVAKEVGLDGQAELLTGTQLDSMSDAELRNAVEKVSLYARTTPEQKLRIVNALHQAGEVVAVTGDGINDAPALAAADIGIAMGKKGTDVARETAAIVLSDDNYSTLVRSVQEGRTLFANLTKGVRYYLACKVALVAVTLLPVLLLVPVPFAPIQIILMELFMDLAASATFVAEPAEADVMKRPPRDPRARFLDRAMVQSVFSSAGGLFLAVVTAYLVTWYGSHNLPEAQTVAFVTWLVGHVLLALNMRSEREPLLRLGVLSNRLMVVWVAATLCFTFVVTTIPAAQTAFKTAPLSPYEWLLLVSLAWAGTFWLEARKWMFRPKAVRKVV